MTGSGSGLAGLGLETHYQGRGSVLADHVVGPALGVSTRYDRLTSFFSCEALSACGEGLEKFWGRQGRMRLIVGIHSVPAEFLRAASRDEYVDAVCQDAERRIVRECSSLLNELQRNRIGTLALMMRTGFLAMKVAMPSWRSGEASGAIFHSKRLIFEDDQGACVVGVGSVNETGPALSHHYEELTLDFSWQRAAHCLALRESFERIWRNERADLEVRPVSEALSEELLAALSHQEHRARPEAGVVSLNAFRDALEGGAEYASVNLAPVALFHHQERAVRDALSRTPIRVLLADEVGLGKTLEAGYALAYAMRHRAVKRALLLTPANLRQQWQTELRTHFAVEAAIYEPGQGAYVFADGRRVPAHKSNPLQGCPDIAIMSWHFAKDRCLKSKWMEAPNVDFDLVMCDEAHNARRRSEAGGQPHGNRLWRLLDQIAQRVPNVLLLTATPMQIDMSEYHGLLSILGMPGSWQQADGMEQMLRLVSSTSIDLEGRRRLLRMLEDARCMVGPSKAFADSGQLNLWRESCGRADDVGFAARTGNHIDSLRGLAIGVAPMSLLTVRNTRRALEEHGYRFPRRIFEAPVLALNPDGQHILRLMTRYLNNFHGEMEKAAGVVSGSAKGFVNGLYHQRLVSSFASARETLRKREERVTEFIATERMRVTDEDEYGEVGDRGESMAIAGARLHNAMKKAEVEQLELREILQRLTDEWCREDPKLQETRRLVAQYLERGDRILVFTRFTDTLSAIEAGIGEAVLLGSGREYAVYSGERVEVVRTGEKPTKTDKAGVVRALTEGRVRVVLCTDAASEGINLQAANTIINVDVPWNPARLEQRIGRIARLGQRAGSVTIVNLWYPGTIEERMYRRLLQRQEAYETAVGEFPDIVGQEMLKALGNDSEVDVEHAIAELTRLRARAEYEALRQVWKRDGSGVTWTQEFRTGLCRLASDVLQRDGWRVERKGEQWCAQVASRIYRFSDQPGDVHAISLRHEVLAEVWAAAARGPVPGRFGVLMRRGQMQCLLEHVASGWAVVDGARAIEHLRAWCGLQPPATSRNAVLAGVDDASVYSALRDAFSGRVEPNEILTLSCSADSSETARNESFEIKSFAVIHPEPKG